MFFGGAPQKKVDPIDQAKEWKREIQKEARSIDKDITKLQREEEKAMKECKKLAKSGHVSSVKILAKQVVQTRKSIERMYLAKAQLNSVTMQLQTSVSMLKMTNCISKSTEIMTAMNQLVKLPEISQTMREMAREMAKAGLVQELVDDTLSSMEPEGLESDVDIEVEKIIQQLTNETLAPASFAPTKAISVGAPASKEGEMAPSTVDIDEDLIAMQKRLQSL